MEVLTTSRFFLHSHLDSFPVKCGTISDEHGERFQQHISVIEKRYKGKWSATRLDYWWTMKRDAPEIQYR
jgi:hypothetical protein